MANIHLVIVNGKTHKRTCVNRRMTHVVMIRRKPTLHTETWGWEPASWAGSESLGQKALARYRGQEWIATSCLLPVGFVGSVSDEGVVEQDQQAPPIYRSESRVTINGVSFTKRSVKIKHTHAVISLCDAEPGFPKRIICEGWRTSEALAKKLADDAYDSKTIWVKVIADGEDVHFDLMGQVEGILTV